MHPLPTQRFSGCNRCKHSVCGAGQLRHGHCGVTNVEFGPEFLASLAIAGCRNYAPPMLCDLWAGEGDCHESSTNAGYMATYCPFRSPPQHPHVHGARGTLNVLCMHACGCGPCRP